MDSRFAKPAARNTLVDERPSLPLEQTYTGISSRKSHHHDVGRQRSSKTGGLTLSGRLRGSVSLGQLGSLQGFAYGDEAAAFSPRSSNAGGVYDIPSYPLDIHSFRHSIRPSPSVSSTGRRQDAMEIFEQYGISRPGGWLSEEGSLVFEDVGIPHRKIIRVCHACGEALDARQYCPHCGHDSCLKCTSQVPEEMDERHDAVGQNEHHTFEHSLKQTRHLVEESTWSHIHSKEVAVHTVHQGQSKSNTSGETAKPQIPMEESLTAHVATSPPSPPPLSRQWPPSVEVSGKTAATRPKLIASVPKKTSIKVRNNPFLVADRNAKAKATEPTTTPTHARANKPTRPSDCESHHRIHRSSDSTASVAHRSIVDKLAESADHDVVDTGRNYRDKRTRNIPLKGNLQKRIDQLYQHAEDLHHSQHIMEHLAAGSKTFDEKAVEEKRESKPAAGPSRTSMQQPRDHLLSRDDTTAVTLEYPRHSLVSDVRQPEAVPTEPHSLSDDSVVVEGGVSPRSHSLVQGIITEVAELDMPEFHVQNVGSGEDGEDVQRPPSLELRLYADEPSSSSSSSRTNATKRIEESTLPQQTSETFQHSETVTRRSEFRRQNFLSPDRSVLKPLVYERKQSDRHSGVV